MIKREILIRPTPKEIATEYGDLGSDQQAEVIHYIAREFKSWGYAASDMQLCRLANALSPESQSWIQRLAEFIGTE